MRLGRLSEDTELEAMLEPTSDWSSMMLDRIYLQNGELTYTNYI